jgi:hypothetical protein
MIAKVLTPMQALLLKEAAVSPRDVRNKKIEEVTELIKRQSSNKFFHYTKDGKPDPAMKKRWFHDEPCNLELFEYAGYNVPYAGIKQSEMYRQRSRASLTKGK